MQRNDQIRLHAWGRNETTKPWRFRKQGCDKRTGSYQNVEKSDLCLRKSEIIFLFEYVWQANEKMIIAGDRDEIMPIAQFFLRMVTGNRVCCRWMMSPSPAFRHAEHTIRWQDCALPCAVVQHYGVCRHSVAGCLPSGNKLLFCLHFSFNPLSA